MIEQHQQTTHCCTNDTVYSANTFPASVFAFVDFVGECTVHIVNRPDGFEKAAVSVPDSSVADSVGMASACYFFCKGI